MTPMGTHAGPDEDDPGEGAENTIPQTRAKRNKMKPKWMKDYDFP